MSVRDVREYTCNRCGFKEASPNYKAPEDWYVNGPLVFCPACHELFDEFMKPRIESYSVSPTQPENSTL